MCKYIETVKNIQYSDIVLILSGIIMGTIARIITLRVDFRQNPSYPNGFFINLVIGFITSILGAVAIPALMAKDFTAVTFLALGIQHFRDIRKLESESLGKLENEARYYISLFTALFTVFVMKIFYTNNLYINCSIEFVTGIIIIFSLKTFTKEKSVGDIYTITEGKITVKQSELYACYKFIMGR